MYYFRYRNRAQYPHPTLCEMTAREAKDEIAKASATGWQYKRVTSETARQWVKQGGHHETALYVDSAGRVRYAKDGY